MPSNVKTIGNSGQISLGKQHAGKHVLVEEVEPGVWVVKVGDFVPASERWLHEPEAAERVEQGLRWAAENPPAETDLEELERRLDG
jgi:hypothetical protein